MKKIVSLVILLITTELSTALWKGNGCLNCFSKDKKNGEEKEPLLTDSTTDDSQQQIINNNNNNNNVDLQEDKSGSTVPSDTSNNNNQDIPDTSGSSSSVGAGAPFSGNPKIISGMKPTKGSHTDPTDFNRFPQTVSNDETRGGNGGNQLFSGTNNEAPNQRMATQNNDDNPGFVRMSFISAERSGKPKETGVLKDTTNNNNINNNNNLVSGRGGNEPDVTLTQQSNNPELLSLGNLNVPERTQKTKETSYELPTTGTAPSDTNGRQPTVTLNDQSVINVRGQRGGNNDSDDKEPRRPLPREETTVNRSNQGTDSGLKIPNKTNV